MKKNLENEIAESPWDTVLEKAKLTFMMDGGWDQRASGKAYNSAFLWSCSVRRGVYEQGLLSSLLF
jgi:hypothetical protein